MYTAGSDPMKRQLDFRHPAVLAAGIALVTLAVYAPTLGYGFIDVYDDGQYVLSNAVVRRGLTVDGIAWAFGVHAHNWHPLTWVSHMADVSLFGLDPRGHHLVSVLLHAGNAVLVFLLVAALLESAGAAALVALAFALHPLRLESVAWIAERKDVLSAFLGLASLLAYLRAARSRSRAALLFSWGALGLGLLAKGTLVTWPLLLLLIDAWPLGRLSAARPEERRRALLEKLPFVALAAAVAGATLYAQGSTAAMASGQALALEVRAANAVVSVFGYLGKLAWPARLSIFYPHPGAAVLGWQALAATAGLVMLTALAIRVRRQVPAAAFGWAWFLITLLPVLGLVQVGRQAMADRYTYLPSIGILIAVVSFLSAVARRAAPVRGAALAGTAGLAACAGLAVSTAVQSPVWRDSASLFTHARAMTVRNAIAANALGVLAARAGRLPEALLLYGEAVDFDPTYGTARQNLAALLLAIGRADEAFPHAAEAARLDPANPSAHYVHGVALELHGLLVEASAEYEAALALRPDYESALERLRALRAGAAAR